MIPLLYFYFGVGLLLGAMWVFSPSYFAGKGFKKFFWGVVLGVFWLPFIIFAWYKQLYTEK